MRQFFQAGKAAWRVGAFLAAWMTMPLGLAQTPASPPSANLTAKPATLATVRLGLQPLGVSAGVIGATMRRDRVFQRALAAQGVKLEATPYAKGAEIVPLLADGQLDAGLLGDIPTLMSTATGQGLVLGLTKQTSTAIVARGALKTAELAGKRVGYVALSSAHHTLLQGLQSANLSEQDIRPVAMPVADMPQALAKGEIDAFAAWEPAPTIALGLSREHRVVFRGQSSDYFVLTPAFAVDRPQQAKQLAASFVRAIQWLRLSRANLAQAVQWAKADADAFAGRPLAVSADQMASIVTQELLRVPSAPVIPARKTNPPLRGEFEFLDKLGKLPPGAAWSKVEAAFRYDGLEQVMAKPGEFALRTFDYGD